MPVLVTGAAGFIGHAVCEHLLKSGEAVIGVDLFNAYYNPSLKEARAATLDAYAHFRMVRMDIADTRAMADLVKGSGVDRVVHLAAQAGVRYSIEDPFAYSHCNLTGHLSVLEACRHAPKIRHLVYASSSSVYGDRPIGHQGFREDEAAQTPSSLYAATKRSCELMSASYAHLYGLRQAGLRFFTVYGPWGRPDMAYYSFTRDIIAGRPIEVFGEGRMARDFTYIDDIVDGIIGTLQSPSMIGGDGAHQLYNIGDSRPVGLMQMIEMIEKAVGRPAIKIMRPMQPGDVTSTFADISKLKALTGYDPNTPLDVGIPRFVDWYRGHHS
jgi:UDP-glucuronate 4-epimerase